MAVTKTIARKKLVFSTAAFIASTAIGAIPANAWTEQEKRDAYLNSEEFTECDLKRMAYDLGYGSYEIVKISIGEDILDGLTDHAKRKSKKARESQRYNRSAQCTFGDGNYTYEDAEDLAKFWGMFNVEDAKKQIVKWMDEGYNKNIRRDLKQAWK